MRDTTSTNPKREQRGNDEGGTGKGKQRELFKRTWRRQRDVELDLEVSVKLLGRGLGSVVDANAHKDQG